MLIDKKYAYLCGIDSQARHFNSREHTKKGKRANNRNTKCADWYFNIRH